MKNSIKVTMMTAVLAVMGAASAHAEGVICQKYPHAACKISNLNGGGENRYCIVAVGAAETSASSEEAEAKLEKLYANEDGSYHHRHGNPEAYATAVGYLQEFTIACREGINTARQGWYREHGFDGREDFQTFYRPWWNY